MAFGAPSKSQAAFYVIVTLTALAAIVVLDSIWIKSIAGLLGLYGIVCLFVTNAWAALLPVNKRRFVESKSENDQKQTNANSREHLERDPPDESAKTWTGRGATR